MGYPPLIVGIIGAVAVVVSLLAFALLRTPSQQSVKKDPASIFAPIVTPVKRPPH
jgi:hypothetical protein